MTGKDLFSVLIILTMIICIVLQVKHKIKLFYDDYWYEVLATIIFVSSLIGTLFIIVFWFGNNWSNKIL